jgi:capsular polysaccharide export protein
MLALGTGLLDWRGSPGEPELSPVQSLRGRAGTDAAKASRPARALFRVPPFPGSRSVSFARKAAGDPNRIRDGDIDRMIESTRSHRVGGTYWGAQPSLPEARYTLVRVRDRDNRAALLRALPPGPVLCWTGSGRPGQADAREEHTISGECDPWHILARAASVIVDSDDELAIVAAIAGRPVECVGGGRFSALSTGSELREAFRTHVVGGFDYLDPFTGEPISFGQVIEHCAFWRRLIDGNRDISGAVGIAFWKRPTVAPLLWRGSSPVPFLSDPAAAHKGDRIAIWKARTSAAAVAELARREVELVEVEDGFIRSVGLGADCIPPLSIVVDRRGAHFDPAQASELELLLQQGEFSSDLLDRAKRLRDSIVASGVSKYSAGCKRLERRCPDRRHILVTGQVEDDRAVISGGAGLTSNLELLRRVRALAPEAYLLYKPHPDVEAGHRQGAIPDELCRTIADEIVREDPISSLLDMADEVHVNTSLAGFEALLREKSVTTHGVPFYAGWGLTRDLGPVPSRRSRKRTLDELVAAVLLVYPRYLDPETRLPCPPEVLIRRLSEPGTRGRDGFTVRLRRLQGRCRRGMSILLGRR